MDDDWIRLMVKYKGKCSACGKEITAGQYALWSKSSKAIKHSECNTTTTSSQTVTTEKKQVDMNRQQSMAAKVDCFICSRPVARKDSEFVESDSYGKQSISQASICNECLEDKNAYQNYQYAFIERVRKVAKVKTWT
jgi:endogenous inhibitor of DNA gyrase (YacG/DUF329 family)